MKTLDNILAKSLDRGGTTLLEHTQQVVQAIKVFAKEYQFDFDLQIAIKAAVLHDLGKAHPHFQKKISGDKNTSSLQEALAEDYIHRHELSSIGFLPIFPKAEWNDLIDLVVAHHKAIKDDKRERGILDLDEAVEFWKENHLLDWEKWAIWGLEILNSFGYSVRTIPMDEAMSALEYAVEYCEQKPQGSSPLRGLLMSADHFASAFIAQTPNRLQHLFATPNLHFYHRPDRKSPLYPLSQLDTDTLNPHTMVVAPTGAGKTDFLLKRCKGRIFYTLPFQASINAMYKRIKEDIKKENSNIDEKVRVLHSTSALLVKGNKEAEILQSFAGASIKVLTPHQLAAIVFGTAGFESIMLDVKGCDVILDEIHTYSDVGRSMVIEIIRTLLRLDCRIHVGTATMPSVLYDEVLQLLKQYGSVYEVKLADKILDEFDRHIVHKVKDNSEEAIEVILKEAFKAKEKVLLIYNTVAKAQAAYKLLVERFSEIPIMLIHSRFRRGDRVKLEERLKREFNGDGSTDFGDGLKPCLVISTQVVEVSLDISFDRMITEAAPLDALIQRFGRINRKRSEKTRGRYKPVHVLPVAEQPLPYKKDILERSYAQLPDGALLKERELQAKIDAVYPELIAKSIDAHLLFHNGQYRIKELCNRPNAIIVDALEIESATCILEVDEEQYIQARWSDRIPLEIPVNYRTISKYKDYFKQLEIGAYPFVIPQSEVEHLQFGLELIKPDNFL